MPVFVTRRKVLTRPHIAAVDLQKSGLEDLRTDQLVVAHRRSEGLTNLAAAAVATCGQWVVDHGASLVRRHRLQVGADLVGHRRIFWPHAGVDHGDDDVLALDVLAVAVQP